MIYENMILSTLIFSRGTFFWSKRHIQSRSLESLYLARLRLKVMRVRKAKVDLGKQNTATFANY